MFKNEMARLWVSQSLSSVGVLVFDTKTVRGADGATVSTLVREFGFNDYRKTTDFDFGPAYRYWEKTAPYWANVRARWDATFAQGGVRLKTKVDGMAMIIPLFEQAGRLELGKSVADAEIETVFARWVESVDTAASGTTAVGQSR